MTTTTLLRLPDEQQRRPLSAAFAGNDAVIALARAPRGGNGAGDPLMEIVVVDLGTKRTVHTITTMTESDFVDGGRSATTMAVSGDTVFWDSRARYDDHTGSVRSYDLATGRTATVHTGARVQPRSSAGGVIWGARDDLGPFAVHVAADDVPAAVRATTDLAARASLGTDGRRWAWYSAARHRIGWYDGTRLRWLTGDTLPLTQNDPGQVTVAGDYVFFGSGRPDGATTVVDVRTGATATLPTDTTVAGSAGTSLVAGIDRGSAGSFLGRADVSRLPALSC